MSSLQMGLRGKNMFELRFLKLIAALTGAALLLAILVSTIAPIDFRPHALPGHADLERFFAFAASAFSLAFAFPRQRLPVLVFTMCFAVGLEASQLLTDTRHARPYDAVVKVAGCFFGVAIVNLLLMARHWLSAARKQ